MNAGRVIWPELWFTAALVWMPGFVVFLHDFPEYRRPVFITFWHDTEISHCTVLTRRVQSIPVHRRGNSCCCHSLIKIDDDWLVFCPVSLRGNTLEMATSTIPWQSSAYSFLRDKRETGSDAQVGQTRNPLTNFYVDMQLPIEAHSKQSIAATQIHPATAKFCPYSNTRVCKAVLHHSAHGEGGILNSESSPGLSSEKAAEQANRFDLYFLTTVSDVLI